jgi:hypothetical protein
MKYVNKFDKKDVIDAVKYQGFYGGGYDYFDERPNWLVKYIYKNKSVRFFDKYNVLNIGDRDSPIYVYPGDYIVKGKEGPEAFNAADMLYYLPYSDEEESDIKEKDNMVLIVFTNNGQTYEFNNVEDFKPTTKGFSFTYVGKATGVKRAACFNNTSTTGYALASENK